MHYDDDFIESYLNSTLSAEEAEVFQKAMEGDPALAEYVNNYAKMLAGVDLFGDKLLAEKIKQAEQKLDRQAFFVTDEEVEDYLMETLPLDKQIELTKLSVQNPNFHDRIETHRLILEGIELHGDEALNAQLNEAVKELEQADFFEQKEEKKPIPSKNKTSKRNTLIYYLVAAASVAVLVILVGLGQIPMLSGSVPHYAYFEKMDDHLGHKIDAELSEKGFGGQPAEALKVLKSAMFHYRQAQFNQATEGLVTYLKENPMANNVPQVQLYLATCYIAKKKPKKALPLLLSLQTAPPPDELKVDAKWYLALTYAQLKKNEEAKALLKGLLEDEKYKVQSEKLLKELDN